MDNDGVEERSETSEEPRLGPIVGAGGPGPSVSHQIFPEADLGLGSTGERVRRDPPAETNPPWTTESCKEWRRGVIEQPITRERSS